jgi:capsular polysaccharide export protein
MIPFPVESASQLTPPHGASLHADHFLESRFRAHRITDLILFGDRRPIHQGAIDLARAQGARVHVFEEGYIRPNWITVERNGTNALSRLPRDPLWYLEVNGSLPQHGEGRPVRVPLKLRAGQDLTYRVWNLLNPVIFPGYRTHRPFVAPVEYAGWARRFAAMPLAERADSRLIHRILARKGRYFLLPLQLNGDAQIVHHSMFRDMGEVIDRVIGSFAAHAPKDAEIIVKNHPLDTGLYAYARQIARLRKALDLHERVHYIESGHLPTLLEHAAGTVVVNSSVGMSALHHGCPTKALANPIYDMPGLTFGGSLEKFWNEPLPPDRELFLAFRNVVIHATQVNGDFFTREGVDLAVTGCDRMLGELSPLEEIFARHGEPEGG